MEAIVYQKGSSRHCASLAELTADEAPYNLGKKRIIIKLDTQNSEIPVIEFTLSKVDARKLEHAIREILHRDTMLSKDQLDRRHGLRPKSE